MVYSGRILLLGANYEDVANGYTATLVRYSLVSRRLMNVMIVFQVISPILLLYYVQQKIVNRFIVIGLFAASILPSLSNISNGSKTQVIFFSLYFFGLYLLLQRCYPATIKRLLQRLIVALGSIVVGVVIMLAIGRYTLGSRQSDAGPMAYLFQYTAESMYNFNENAYHETKRLSGIETALPLLRYIGVSGISIEERRDYIDSKIKSPSYWFYSYVGDIYLDYGWYGAIFVVVFVSLTFSLVQLRRRMLLPDFLFLGIYIYLMVNSLFYFSLKLNWNAIIATVFVAAILKAIEYKRKWKM